MMRLRNWIAQHRRNANLPAEQTASDAARALAKLKPEEQRKRVLRNMQALRKELGMPPAKVTL